MDESCFSSEKAGIKIVKRPINTRYCPEFINKTSHCARKLCSVFGIVSNNGVGPLVRLNSRLCARTYAEILDTVVADYIKERFCQRECIWIEDNCPSHRAELVNEWFGCCAHLHGINVRRLKLPPYSPEINLIENVWGYLKYRLLYDDETLPVQMILWHRSMVIGMA